MTLLTAKHLTIAIAQQGTGQIVVDDVSFQIKPNETVALIGESGSGKTMIGLSLTALLPAKARVAASSEILFNLNGTEQQDLLALPEEDLSQIRGKDIGMIFQDPMTSLNPVLTVKTQLLEVYRRRRLQTDHDNSQQTLHTLFKSVGIQEPQILLEKYPHQLSGGQQQRVMIAMAIASKPKLLIADEPTTALDVTVQKQVLELLKSIQHNSGMGMLFITHDLAVAKQVANHVIVLKNGKLIESASSDRFFEAPKHEYSKRLIDLAPSMEVFRETRDHGPDTLLSVKNLTIQYRQPKPKGIKSRRIKSAVIHTAVSDVNFDIQLGETLALVGESGSGKTSTGKGLLKFLPMTGGEVSFETIDLMTAGQSRLGKIRRQCQIIYQDPVSALNPRMKIIDVIVEAIDEGSFNTHEEKKQRVEACLKQVGLEASFMHRYPHEFSGGQRQRICIARALATKPKMLILDEPTSALDMSIQSQILELLLSLQRDLQLTYLLITHDMSIVSHLAHRVAVMKDGKIVEQGPTSQILKSPQHPYTQRLITAAPVL